ncbi:transketolase [Candidatus Woesearchaeota archaeon]|nr:transketolase [Candidatus Woesearchaeota archaeon]
MQKEDVLQDIAKRLRYHVLVMTSRAGSGHPTTCMSCAELAACLFFDEMRYNIKDANDLGNDEFVLSKGHASPLLWACYAEAGIFPLKKLEEYRSFGSVLEGHPTPRMPWVKAATGSLGQGLSVGVGMALGLRLRNLSSRVFVLLGDGECAEGSVWEAVELAKKLDMSNIVAVVDCNRLGQSGESLHGWDVKRWQQKFAGFGWNVFVVNGHDVHDILHALSLARTTHGPCVILAKTIKGKGVSFLENKEGWHGKALKSDDLKKALAELGPVPVVDCKKFVRVSPRVNPPVLKKGSPGSPKYKLGELVATREAFGVMLEKLGVDERIVSLDGDVKNSTFSEKFFKLYPKRGVECFIAEQNMVGMAQGMAAKGFIPFASTFSAFLTRAHDQLRMSAISQSNIKLCGSHCGVSIGEDGPSQMGLEDLALFRSLPGSVVLYPCDAVSSEKCTQLLAKHVGIGYLRTSRPKTPVIYENNENFEIGGSKIVRRSFRDKVAIITAGVTVHEAVKASDALKKEKKFVRVIDAYSIKPLDASAIRSVAKKMPVVVVEDHYAEGGLGEAVAALGIPITHLCIREIPRSGKPEELMKDYGIDAGAIVKVCKKL